ncbi:MAG: colicin V production CvpA [Piscirickettsiaceae bacterium]|nr:MAG: colicin V production CvpA [Piscirickettsiaceae bacterium]PCI72376.1 MAG: colicin V production CvpA [Piscirickettsiaceae bacterium]
MFDVSLNNLIWVDFIIIGIICISALIGLFRGLIKEAFSLGIWLVSIWIAINFSQSFSAYFVDYIDVPSARIAVAFICLLILTLILGGMLSFLMSQIIDITGLTGTDRFAGFLFGIARGVVVMSVLILLAGLTPLPQDPWWVESTLIGPFQELSVWLRAQIPEGMSEYLSY